MQVWLRVLHTIPDMRTTNIITDITTTDIITLRMHITEVADIMVMMDIITGTTSTTNITMAFLIIMEITIKEFFLKKEFPEIIMVETDKIIPTKVTPEI